jgi:hypothetical protein
MKLLVHQNTFASQFQEYANEKRRNKDELASELGLFFINRGREIFRELGRAEDALAVAKCIAIETGIPAEIVEYPDEESDDDDETEQKNLKRNPKEDVAEPDLKRVLEWLEDPERPEKHKRRMRPEKYESYQLFDCKPVRPSDSLSMTEECLKKREKLEAHKKQSEADQEKLDEPMPDALPEADSTLDSTSFSIPTSNTRWDKRWEARRRST